MISLLAQYNEAIWPVQIIAYVLAGFLLYFAIRPTDYSTRVIAAILSLFWLWTGFAFFLLYAVEHSPTYYFSTLFAFQGFLFLFHAVWPRVDLSCTCRRDVYDILGLVLILYTRWVATGWWPRWPAGAIRRCQPLP